MVTIAILIVSISVISMLIITACNNRTIERQAYHDAIRVTTNREFDQALKGNHTILVTTKLVTTDPVSSDKNIGKDNLLYYTKSHVMTTTVMVPMQDGKNTTMMPQTQTQVADDDAKAAKNIMIFDHSYSANNFKLNKLIQTESAGGYDYEFVSAGKTITFLAQTKDGKLLPINSSKQIKLYPYTQKEFDHHMKN